MADNLRRPTETSTEVRVLPQTPIRIVRTKSSPSILFTMLPGAVRDRLPTMGSLPRSLRSRSPRDKRPHSADFAACDVFTADHRPADPQTRHQSARSIAFGQSPNNGWKYANQGLNLLESAVAEAQCPDSGSQAFARQLYVHALTYLLHGLPHKLSEAEAASLRSALPAAIQSPGCGGQENRASDKQRPSSVPPRSILHRLLASGIVQLFLLIGFLLPYLKVLIRAAYCYERQHHISERVFVSGIGTGRRSLGAVGTLLNSDNGRVGSLLAGSLAWWVDGISGGIHDGVGEGMAIIGAVDVQQV